RHVCNHQQTIAEPVPIQQSYTRAVYRKDLHRTIYQTAYRTIFKMQIRYDNVTGCCPGWEKKSPRDPGCNKPVCDEECENDGQCVGPGICICNEGYTGYKCHIDIDECSGRNTCQQKCTNLPGSYECSCQDGFTLADDEYTCDFSDMKETLVQMSSRIQQLESDKATLQSNLSHAVAQYENTISAFKAKEVVTKEQTTTDPYETDQQIPLDRLVSLSEQISILEERMADCACGQDYPHG
ncbi:unnamed protein product, partial [Candidula unifasciata]